MVVTCIALVVALGGAGMAASSGGTINACVGKNGALRVGTCKATRPPEPEPGL